MTRVERGMSSLIMMITKQKAHSGWYIIVNLPRSTTLVNLAQDFSAVMVMRVSYVERANFLLQSIIFQFS